MTMEERSSILEASVRRAARKGWRVVSQTQTQAQLVKGKPTNHLLHLLLSIFTLGLWIPVWIGISLFSGQDEVFVTVTEDGAVVDPRGRIIDPPPRLAVNT